MKDKKIPMWGTQDIRLGFNTKLYNNNINYVSDLFNEEGIRLTVTELSSKQNWQYGQPIPKNSNNDMEKGKRREVCISKQQ